MNKYMILVVEDDAAIRNLIVTTLETQGYRYKTAVSGKEALMEAATHNPDILLLDLACRIWTVWTSYGRSGPGLPCRSSWSVPEVRIPIK